MPKQGDKTYKISKNVLRLIVKLVVTLAIIVIFILLVHSGNMEITPTLQQFSGNDSYGFSVPEYDFSMENDLLRVSVDTHTLQFEVIDKRNNHFWQSVITQEDTALNKTWLMFFNSPITVEFFDYTNNMQRAYLTRDAKISVKRSAENILTANVEFENIGVSFDVSYELIGDSLRLKVDNLKEKQYKLISLYLYPYLGGSKGNVSGAFILADGVGAKIDLQKKTVATAPLKMRIYGNDIGFQEVLPYSYFKNVREAENYALPFYGVLYKSNNTDWGLLTVIEEGDLYTEINAYKSGIVTDSNWITPRIVLRDLHKKLLNKAGEGITVPQENINIRTLSIRYIFMQNANEYTLAQRFVYEYGKNNTKNSSENAIRFKFDILMAWAKKGTFGYVLVKMTDEKQLQEVKRKIREKVPESIFVLHGFSKGGQSLSSPKHLPFEKRILREVTRFSEDFFYVDYILASKESRTMRKIYIAQNMLEQLMEYENRYVLSPKYMCDVSATEIGKFERMGIKKIAFGNLGRLVFSTNNLRRDQVLSDIKDIIRSAKSSMVYGYNWQVAKLANAISDMTLTNSGYEIEDEVIPIVPYILGQLAMTFSKPLNLSSNYSKDLLACIEYGVLPSFYLTWNDSEKLIETDLRDLVSTKFDDWYDKIFEAYKLFESASKFFSSRLTTRESISRDIYLDTYENGIKVIFNYTDKPYKFNQIIIKPSSFFVLDER